MWAKSRIIYPRSHSYLWPMKRHSSYPLMSSSMGSVYRQVTPALFPCTQWISLYPTIGSWTFWTQNGLSRFRFSFLPAILVATLRCGWRLREDQEERWGARWGGLGGTVRREGKRWEKAVKGEEKQGYACEKEKMSGWHETIFRPSPYPTSHHLVWKLIIWPKFH